MRKAYQSYLSDAEWSCLAGHLPTPKANGRPRLHGPREITDAKDYEHLPESSETFTYAAMSRLMAS